MKDICVSICASAYRVKDWIPFLESLKGTKIPYEVVFVGPNKPDFENSKYPEFKYIESKVKPCQCYEIAYRHAVGEVIGWSADDGRYNINGNDNVDRIYNFYKSFNTEKIVVAQRPIEDGRDIWHRHHFFGDWSQTPVMAPLGFMSREYFHRIGGYDRNFISGQSENDICMRVLEDGGRVERCMDSYVHIFHQLCHERSGPQSSGMRQYYVADRQYLENCWVHDGYGAYGAGGAVMRSQVHISKTRLLPVESFEEKDLITTTQGPKGKW